MVRFKFRVHCRVMLVLWLKFGFSVRFRAIFGLGLQ